MVYSKEIKNSINELGEVVVEWRENQSLTYNRTNFIKVKNSTDFGTHAGFAPTPTKSRSKPIGGKS